MAESFKIYFLQASLLLNRILKISGVYICPCGSKRKLMLINLWSSVWLLISFQVQLFVFINRVYNLPFLLFGAMSSLNLREFLINMINYLASCILDALVHLLLTVTIRETVNLFLTVLEPIDAKLQSPVLRKYLSRRIRIISIVLILFYVLDRKSVV